MLSFCLTNLILGLLECPINIVVGSPHSWYPLVIVSKAFLEVYAQLRENDSVCSLLIDLRSESLPGAPSNSGEGVGALFFGTIKCWKQNEDELEHEVQKTCSSLW